MTPREVIANWLWTEAESIDFDDMGDHAGQQILDALNKAGFKVVPLRDSHGAELNKEKQP